MLTLVALPTSLVVTDCVYSAITQQGKFSEYNLSQRIGGEIFGKSCSTQNNNNVLIQLILLLKCVKIYNLGAKRASLWHFTSSTMYLQYLWLNHMCN